MGLKIMVAGSAFMGLSSGVALFAQTLPITPQDFKGLPVTAILGFIAFCSLLLAFYALSRVFKTHSDALAVQLKQAETNGKMHETQNDTNDRLAEMCQKMGDLNVHLASRPCLKD